MQTPNDPKDAPRRDTEHDRADPSRKGTGPNNPLPGEPGGPTVGTSPEDRKAAEEGQRREAADKTRAPAPDSKR